MTYQKPELVISGPALKAVQGVNKGGITKDQASPHPFNATSAAYEADE